MYAGAIILFLSVFSILIGRRGTNAGDTELGQKRALLVVYGVCTFIFLPPLTSRWTRSEDIFLQSLSLLHCLSNSVYLPLALTLHFKYADVICAFPQIRQAKTSLCSALTFFFFLILRFVCLKDKIKQLLVVITKCCWAVVVLFKSQNSQLVKMCRNINKL